MKKPVAAVPKPTVAQRNGCKKQVDAGTVGCPNFAGTGTN